MLFLDVHNDTNPLSKRFIHLQITKYYSEVYVYMYENDGRIVGVGNYNLSWAEAKYVRIDGVQIHVLKILILWCLPQLQTTRLTQANIISTETACVPLTDILYVYIQLLIHILLKKMCCCVFIVFKRKTKEAVKKIVQHHYT